MRTQDLLKQLKGIQTIKTVMSDLGVSRQKAIYLLYRLRKNKYVKTKRAHKGMRVYYISPENKLCGISYYDIINENSPIKIARVNEYKAYGKKPKLEEVLIFALQTKSLRTILASLGLFKRINNWKELYKLAKKNDLLRQAGILYDLARTIMKTRKMPKRFRNNSLPKKNDKYNYIIDGLSSDNFTNIEKTWKIYLPFNKNDLEDYKL